MEKITINKLCYDYFENEDYIVTIKRELTSEAFEALKTITAEYMLDHMRKNAIGKITPIGDKKLIPEIQVAGFAISLQCAYYIWKLRTERDSERGLSITACEEHMDEPVTEEEFNSVIHHPSQPAESVFVDVRIKLCDKQLTIGQATLEQIAEFFADVYKHHEANIYSEL